MAVFNSPVAGMVGTIAWMLVVAVGSQGCFAQTKSPNVLLVVIDTLRADRLPLLGHSENTAPFLTELARDCVVFERAWSTSSWTAPATASLFTAVYPLQHGVTTGLRAARGGKSRTVSVNSIPDELETIPEFLASQGYRTFGFADNINIGKSLGFDRGFDRLETTQYQGGEQLNRMLAASVSEISDNAPWFVYLHYMDPHFPYHVRKPWYRANKNEDRRSRLLARYDSEIRYVDERIREAFELLSIDESSLVVVVADHGEEILQRGKVGHEFQLYSELTRVPLLIQHPGIEPARRRVRQNVSLIDVLPTLREILGAQRSKQDQGRSLVSYYSGAEPLPERTLFAMTSQFHLANKRAVIRDSHKYIFTQLYGEAESHELYDLERDPGELHDTASSQAELAQEYRRQWDEFEQTARRWKPRAISETLAPEVLEQLELLGYVEPSLDTLSHTGAQGCCPDGEDAPRHTDGDAPVSP